MVSMRESCREREVSGTGSWISDVSAAGSQRQGAESANAEEGTSRISEDHGVEGDPGVSGSMVGAGEAVGLRGFYGTAGDEPGGVGVDTGGV